jgi:anti-sigma factor RsiW
MNCQAYERYLDAVLDQEADANARLLADEHVASCAGCRDRMAFASWLKSSVKQVGRVDAPESLRARVSQALVNEESGFSLVRVEGNWRATLAVAAMALLVFGVGGMVQLRSQQVSAGITPLFEDVVRAHTRTYPADVARGDQVPAYFSEKVGFAVRPVDFGDPGIRFVGARHAEVGGRKAVTLHYEARGRRMTVVAFRPPAHARTLGEVVDTEGRRLRYVRVGGHLVPLVEHRGVVYAVVGDLDAEDGLRLAASASLR